jgi:hypothetical protein
LQKRLRLWANGGGDGRKSSGGGDGRKSSGGGGGCKSSGGGKEAPGSLLYCRQWM